MLSLAGAKVGNRFCALLENGGVRCWGRGFFPSEKGGLNIGDDEHPESIDFIPLNEEAIQVAVGGSHACALLSSGGVKCWGQNFSGQLGLGHNDSDKNYEQLASRATIQFPREKITKMVVGLNFTCAQLKNAGVRCWGSNNFGQLGYGHRDDIGDNELPSSVPAISFGDNIIDL